MLVLRYLATRSGVVGTTYNETQQIIEDLRWHDRAPKWRMAEDLLDFLLDDPTYLDQAL